MVAMAKQIHLYAVKDIDDLSIYGIGVANNGGGTDGLEENLDYSTEKISAGDDILLARNPDAMKAYFTDTCYKKFDHVFTATSSLSQNGDDAIELFMQNDKGVYNVIETFGNIDMDGSGQDWEYTNSWAYKEDDGRWTYGGLGCTGCTDLPPGDCTGINAETIFEATCLYPTCGCQFDLNQDGADNVLDIIELIEYIVYSNQ